MICEVLVKRAVKDEKSFDYQTDKPIKLFTLVEVSLGKQKVQGIVTGIKPRSKFTTKTIERELSVGPVINKLQFDFAKEISQYFLGSLSDTLNRFIPALNKKDLKQIGAKDSSYRKTGPKKPVFVMGERSSRIEHFCQLADNRQNLLILPTLKAISDAAEFIKKISPKFHVFAFHSQLDSDQKSKIYQTILAGDDCIIIGTRHGLFLPFSKLSNIFIDEPFNYAYQEDQAPYYNTFISAKILSKLCGARLIVGDSCPGLIDFAAISKNKMDIVELKNNLSFITYNNPKKISQNNFFIELVKKSLENRKSVGFIGNFRNSHKVYCGNCNNKITCSHCRGEYFMEETNLCEKCDTKLDKCADCKSDKRYYIGITYSDIMHQIKEMWPDFSDSIETRVSHFEKKQILVTTYREILSLEKDVNVFVIADFDFIASSPLFSNRINLFRKILDLKSRGAKKIIIFSDEKSEYLNDLVNGNWRNFLKRELSDRKSSSLPPYSVPVEIFYSAKTEKSAVEKLNRFSSLINSKILKISLPITKKGDIFTAKQVLFLRHNFREIDKKAFLDKSIKVRIGPIDYF